MRRLNSLAFAAAVAGILVGCVTAKTPESRKNTIAARQDSAVAVSDAHAGAGKSIPDKTILFFMNPNGRPCQMQNEILSGMKDTLTGLANVKLIKTTDPDVRDQFMKYGIRGLPSLIIVDKNGKELSRFSPGIQEERTILDALKAPKGGT